jgi:hypothetical protein
MKEPKEELNSEFHKICSICNKEILDLKHYNLKNSNQNKKLKDNMKFMEYSKIIKKCLCQNYINNSNNENGIYAHKYCILLKVIYNFETKCNKCNTSYNIKIDKKVDIKKKIYLIVKFVFIYMVHLIFYLFCIFLIFINNIIKKNSNKKYKYLPIFLSAILFLINNIILYFTIINNIKEYKYIFKYKIDICNAIELNVNNIKNKSKIYELLYDYYKWFFVKSKRDLIIAQHKNYLINNGKYNNSSEIQRYIKENNYEFDKSNYKIDEQFQEKIIENNHDSIDNYLTLKNNTKCENEDYNPFVNFKKMNNMEEEIKEDNNDILEDLYSDKTDNNEDNKINNEIKTQKNIIAMTSINKNRPDYINININQPQGNNINININFNKEINNLNKLSRNESSEIVFNPSKKLNENTGKSALIPNKNLMNKIMEENNNYYQYLKKRKQIKSIKLKQKNVKIQNTKIGDIQENEEIDFSEFEKGKMESKISKESKINKFYFLKNHGSANDLFKTKKSYKDVALTISNPTDSIAFDELSNNRCSFKNNIISKNANFSNTNLLQDNKKNS